MKPFARIAAIAVMAIALPACAGVTDFKLGGASGPTGGAAGPDGAQNAPAQIEKCDKPLGTLAIAEPQDYVAQALAQMGLPNPNGLIRLMVQQSNCFMVVERGVAFQNIRQERELAEGGQLRKGSNIGKGQLATADYVMTPEIVFRNNDAGGVGGAIGGIFGAVGAAVGGSLKTKEAQATLALADTRSGIQVASASGSSSKTDFGVGGLFGGGGLGAGLGAYENTAEGKVVAAAFLDSWNGVVKSVRGNPDLARTKSTLKHEAAAVVNSGEVAHDGDVWLPKIANVPVFDKPNGKKVVTKLGRADEVVSSGEEQGGFIKVQGANGEGWVKKSLLRKGG